MRKFGSEVPHRRSERLEKLTVEEQRHASSSSDEDDIEHHVGVNRGCSNEGDVSGNVFVVPHDPHLQLWRISVLGFLINEFVSMKYQFLGHILWATFIVVTCVYVLTTYCRI